MRSPASVVRLQAVREAVRLLREVGYSEVVRFEGRRRVAVPLPEAVR